MSPPDDVALAPSLPLELPEFEGRLPIGTVTRLNGSGQRIRRAMHYEERVVLVVEAEVGNVGHAKTGDGMKRVHVLNVLDLYELEGKPGAVLLRSLRQAYKLADDHAAGRKVLGILDQPEPAGPGIKVTVDGNGVVLTDAEAAAMRGEIVEGLPYVDVAVIVFEDGARALWPDDFAGAAGPHPEASERIRKPGAKAKDDPVLITAVLDPDTGETIEEWTAEQEAARLVELEEVVARDEARQDREAHEELLAARAGSDPLDSPDTPEEVTFVEDEEGFADVAGTGNEVASSPRGHPSEEPVGEGGTIVELDPARLEASRLLSDPVSGGYRALGSVKTALGDVEDPAVVACVIELEAKGKRRKGILEAAERRLNELGRVTT